MDGWAKLLGALRELPLWLFGGLTVAGFAFLYLPILPGFDLTSARAAAGSWVASGTLAATVLFAAQGIARLAQMGAAMRKDRPRPTLRLTANSQLNTTWWSATPQADGTTITQLHASINAFNLTTGQVRLVSTRLISPRVAPELFLPTPLVVSDPAGGPLFSSKHPIRPGALATVSVTFLVSRVLSRARKHLPVVIGVTDHNGCEHRLRVRLWPVPIA